MMKMKMMSENRKILYIGNNLTRKTKYPTTLETLSNLLKIEKYTVYTSSNKINKVIRLVDMCFSVIYYRNKIDYLLIDTYSTTNFYYALITSQLARVFKIKYIPILHGGNLPRRLIKSKFFSKMIFNNSYKNIAPSNYLKSEFEKHSYKTSFIPNTLNIKEYSFKERKFIQPRLLWVRAFKQIYNPVLAVQTLKLLKEKHPNSTLCMIGPFLDNSYEETLELIEKYGLKDSVEFTGVLSKKEWHKKSIDYDIFINTTNFDNTPVSVIEAMALGLPIVSTNVGGLPYLIDHQIDGLLVEKEDSNQMTNAICDLIENKHPKLASSARTKVENFDWNTVKHKWLEVLK